MERQQNGIQKASEQGFRVKINTVLIPDINEKEILEIAEFGKKAGAIRMNLMPLIPVANFSNLRRPRKQEVEKYRKEAELFLPQMYHCRQCRADAGGLLI